MKQNLTLIEILKVIHNYKINLIVEDNELIFTEDLNFQHLLPGALIYEQFINEQLNFNESFDYQLNGNHILGQALIFNQHLVSHIISNQNLSDNLSFINNVTNGSTLHHVITTFQNGNWSNSSTWIGGIVPGDGDLAIINHNVLVNADTIIGDDSNSTVLDVTNGTLTIDGAILTIRGNVTFGKANSGTVVYRLIILNTGDLINGSSTIPVLTINIDTGVQITGPVEYNLY